MKRTIKTIVAVLICIGSLFSVSCNSTTKEKEMDMRDKYYDAVDELFDDYLMYLDYSYHHGMTDYFSREIVEYFEDGDDLFVICKFCSRNNYTDGTVWQDQLLVFVAEKSENGYHLEIPLWMGIEGIYAVNTAIVPLHDDYNNKAFPSYHSWGNTVQLRTKCYGFAYKSIDETRSLYFDGNKMKEIECINPFTNEPFILCYSDEGKFYSLFEMLFVPQHKRHTLEIK